MCRNRICGQFVRQGNQFGAAVFIGRIAGRELLGKKKDGVESVAVK